MKPKGINFFEQHVEKIVTGLALLLVVGLAARAFLTDPNAVRVGTETVSPSKVDAILKDRASSLRAQIGSTSGLDLNSFTDLTQWFNENYENTDLPAPSGVAWVPPQAVLASEGLGDSGAVATERYASLDVPAPKDLQVVPLSYTLSPDAVTAFADLKAMFPGGEPYDINVVHVVADFDGTALKKALAGDIGGDARPIPVPWWEQDMAILDVVVERQRLMPDGTYASPEVVSTIPGQLTLRDLIASAKSSGDRDTALALAGQYGNQLYEPGFFTLMSGVPWSYDILRRSLPLSDEAQAAVDRMQMAWKRYLTAQDQLKRLIDQQQKADERNKSQSGESIGTGRGVKGGGGVEGDEQSSQPTNTGKPRETTAERMRREREESVKETQQIYQTAKADVLAIVPDYDRFPDEDPELTGRRQQENTGSGGKGTYPPDYYTPGGGFGEGTPEDGPPTGMEGGNSKNAPPVAMPRGRTPTARGARGRAKALFDDDKIQVWAHDITAKPGATYRYRVAVGVYNPFFGRESRLAEGQKDLASSLAVLSQFTAWSKPVRGVASQQFFAVAGRSGDSVEDRTARFEVYSFSGGKHRMVNIVAKPGEPIGTQRQYQGESAEDEPVTIDFFTGAVLLDVVQEDGGSALDQKVRVIVAMPDGSIRSIDPDEALQSDERTRLKELAAKEG